MFRYVPAMLLTLHIVWRVYEAKKWFLGEVVSPGKQEERKTIFPGK